MDREDWLLFYRQFAREAVSYIVGVIAKAAILKLLRDELREEEWMWFTACQERGTALSRGVTDIFCEVVRQHPLVP